MRFISNPSSGRMGYLVAAEAARRGHDVHLLSGPVCLEAPEGVRISPFESVDELYNLCAGYLEETDCIVMAAAVGDWKPATRAPGKRKKCASLTLELVPTRDVLASLAQAKGGRVFVGFAMEVEAPVENALGKAVAKSMDLVVVNGPASFGAERAAFTFVFPDGRSKALGEVLKERLAGLILDEAEALFRGRLAERGPI